MVEPKLRSRSFKRTHVVTPGNRNVLHYRRRNPNPVKCRLCKGVLKGIPRVRSNALRQLAKSKKTVARPYGGNLCSRCTRALLKDKARTM
ncbi:50S ribosomal protein L34e [Candidatus Woesearchaeota archaeon]|nr:50S ribosomal protein L34e [Candidatus Woesearchaeota archaeon]